MNDFLNNEKIWPDKDALQDIIVWQLLHLHKIKYFYLKVLVYLYTHVTVFRRKRCTVLPLSQTMDTDNGSQSKVAQIWF